MSCIYGRYKNLILFDLGGGGGAEILQKSIVLWANSIVLINNIIVYCLSPTDACEL